MSPSLARRAVAEMLGTGFLIFFGCSAVVMNNFPDNHYGVMGIAFVHAFILALAITMTMGVSGGHLNPAVTSGLMVIKRIAPVEGFIYIASQLVGALVGALLVRTFMAPNVGHVIAYGTPVLNAQVTFGYGVAIEAIITFLLMSGVMGTIVASNAPKIGGFGVGLTLIPSIMVAGSLTGAAANPARAFGPAIISGNITSLALWFIGPIIGAIVAAVLWDKVLLKRDV